MAVRPETEPVPAHVDAVLRLEVLPRLNQLSRELRHPLEMTVALVRDGIVVGTAPMLVGHRPRWPAAAGRTSLDVQAGVQS